MLTVLWTSRRNPVDNASKPCGQGTDRVDKVVLDVDSGFLAPARAPPGSARRDSRPMAKIDRSGIPRLAERAPQPFVARRARVTTATLPEIADRIPGVLAWLDRRTITPSGPPFLRYSVMSLPDLMVVEAGFPVDELQALDADDEV